MFIHRLSGRLDLLINQIKQNTDHDLIEDTDLLVYEDKGNVSIFFDFFLMCCKLNSIWIYNRFVRRRRNTARGGRVIGWSVGRWCCRRGRRWTRWCYGSLWKWKWQWNGQRWLRRRSEWRCKRKRIDLIQIIFIWNKEMWKISNSNFNWFHAKQFIEHLNQLINIMNK